MPKKTLIFITLVLAAFLAFLFFYYNNHTKTNELILYGNVDVRQVDLGFRVGGKVTDMYFDEGDIIEKGTLLALLDKQPYQDQVKEAESNLEATKLNLKNAEKQTNRRLQLISGGEVSKEEYDNNLTSKNIYEADFKQKQAALGVATTNLHDTELYAPNKGVILTRIREPGTVVKISDPIYTLSLLSPVWIRAYISETELGEIFYGMKADIYTDVPNGKVYEGHIGFISPVAEFTPKTVETTRLRTDLVYRLRVIADNPDEYLKQGMPVTVKLHRKG